MGIRTANWRCSGERIDWLTTRQMAPSSRHSDRPHDTLPAYAAARCPGAIDALCLMYTMTKYTKEAMFPHTGTWTLNEFVMVGGDATSDNLPPRLSQIQYSWRSPTLGIQQQICNVLLNDARQAAATTGC